MFDPVTVQVLTWWIWAVAGLAFVAVMIRFLLAFIDPRGPQVQPTTRATAGLEGLLPGEEGTLLPLASRMVVQQRAIAAAWKTPLPFDHVHNDEGGTCRGCGQVIAFSRDDVERMMRRAVRLALEETEDRYQDRRLQQIREAGV